MGKKRKAKLPKGNVVWHQSAEEATLAAKPRYNGFACGHGAHGSAKYDRAKAKRQWRENLNQGGASRGSFSFRPENRRERNAAVLYTVQQRRRFIPASGRVGR